MEITGNTITEVYVKALEKLNSAPERNSRVGLTKEILDINLILKNPRTRRIIEPLRRQKMSYVANEIKWYLSGDYSVEKIGERAKFWYVVADENFQVYSNYGAKLFREKTRGLSQFERALGELKKNPESRRAVFFFSLYPVDYHVMSSTKDFVCTLYGHCIVNPEKKLDMYIYMRSNDSIWGFGNDVPWFTLIQEMFAVKLKIPMGEYHHHSGSFHIYEKFYPLLEGRKFNAFNEAAETPFAPLTEEDVSALIAENYSIKSPFMEGFNRFVDGEEK